MKKSPNSGVSSNSELELPNTEQCHHQVDYFVVNSSHATIANKLGTNDAQKHFFTLIRQQTKY
jgi:hypothetical protein